ncbi:MAG: formate/nitrite transporter family protein [Peptostreptococcaceae bacterium]|nr:formate/nitrite transporter family protein [Peptostreptococcaceae bacterium]
MFREEVAGVAQLAVKKVDLMNKRPLAYLILSMLAGIYVGVAMFFIFVIGGMLVGSPLEAGAKIMMGLSFAVALSLVVMAGSELFTGNNLVMTIGLYHRMVSWKDAIKLWIFCWVGNWLGSALIAVLFLFTGVAKGPIAEFIVKGANAKMSLTIPELIARGLFCNLLVCLAVWCALKMKSESGKLIMIFWCIFAFITSGFEHSVANMSFLLVGLLHPMGEILSWSGYAYNLFFVTIGNMLGGILLVAIPYAIIAGRENDTKIK